MTLPETKLEEILSQVPPKEKAPQVSYRALYVATELYDDIERLAEENKMGVGDAATILIVEGAFAIKAKMDAAEAARLKAESENVAEVHAARPERIDEPQGDK